MPVHAANLLSRRSANHIRRRTSAGGIRPYSSSAWPGGQLAQRLGRHQRPAPHPDRARAAAGVHRARRLARLLLAGQSREVAQRVQVGHPRQQHPRAVAVDHGLGLAAVAAARLGEVVEDRDELDVVAGRGRGDLGQVGQRRDVAGLVEAQQQRQLQPPPGQGGPLVGAVDDLRQQRQEDRPQQLGRLGVADQVQRRALVQQRVGRDLRRPRRAQHAGEAVGAQQALGRRLDRGAGAVGLGLERAHRVIGGVGALQLGLVARGAGELRDRLIELARALAVGPADHRVHPRSGAGRGEQQRRQALLGGDRPEVAALDAALIQLAGRRQPPRDLERSVPASTAPRSGDHVCPGVPDSSNGSNTNTGPSARRRASVHASRSVLIEEATAGPSHSSSAGTASPADLPDCGGPKATSA